jgi:DNA-binding XRE family transcriptional regulator
MAMSRRRVMGTLLMRRSTMPAVLAEFLRAMRHERGKTQDDVARVMGVPAEHIVRIESGRVEPKLTTVVRFLDALASKLTLVVDSDRPAPDKSKAKVKPRQGSKRPRNASGGLARPRR